MKHKRPLLVAVAGLLAAGAAPAAAQAPAALDSALLAGFRWRSIGPANMSGRITDVEGLPSPSKTFYVAAATGGIWKTTNNGTTFRPVWDQTRVVSMGDLAISPSDSLTLWAGTGEEDSRNSISPGGGIFKSTDGGQSWQPMGLEKTQAIGRIVVHPTDKDVVYVAALGHPWGANPERGLYKTTDGGKSWQLSKFVSDRAGFVDVAMHPRDPNTLFAASWERVRGPWFLQSGGPGSALWKTTDAGRTWQEVRGGGFPETIKGRIGIAIAPSNPDVVYALVEADSLDGKKLSGLYRSSDGGRTWARMNENNVRPFYYSQVRVDPSDPDRVFWSSTPVNFSKDGGRTVGDATIDVHVDHHAMWWDPADPARFIVGNDGGIAVTWDKGGSYDFINTLALGQFYNISYDMAVPYRVCGGLQDNYSWCGPSRRADGEITNHLWFSIQGGDGFVTQQDPRDPNRVYAESQGGNMSRIDLTTGERTSLEKPNWREHTRALRDSLVMLEDAPATADTERRVRDLRARIAADSAAYDLRFNWNTPFFLSPRDPDVFYAGSNRVLKSTNRGDGLVPISPDLTYADTTKIRVSTQTTGGITRDATGAETFHTIVSLAESPLSRGTILAGTDDGRVWITRDDGGRWEELTRRIRGVPAGTYVSRIEPSRHDANAFYVTFDNHRRDDFTPYVFATHDGGRSFRSIAGGLPTGGPDFVHVIREDPVNPNLLFVGTDLGVYASLDRGATWTRFMTGLPTVPVHDLQIHPRDRELIAGTHGRSIWIADIAPLQQLGRFTMGGEPVLFEPKPALRYGDAPVGGEFTAHRLFEGTSAPFGAEIAYWMPEGASPATTEQPADGGRRGRGPRASITVLDARGDTVQTLEGPAAPGLQRAYWNLRLRPERKDLSPSERRDSLVNARMLRAVADSMIAAGGDSATVERVVAAVESGDMSLFRGGNRGSASSPDRPGESYPTPGAAPAAPDAGEVARQIRNEMRNRGAESFGGRGGPQPPLAEPGQYTVRVRIGETELSQPLRVIAR
jgi:photosystem II stability/assembly factor-like uncharacterized protein